MKNSIQCNQVLLQTSICKVIEQLICNLLPRCFPIFVFALHVNRCYEGNKKNTDEFSCYYYLNRLLQNKSG